MSALRKGKTKSTLEASIDAALLAVEIYNKPRTTFRSEGFITLMIIAWTRLFHAHFYSSIGDKYYYKRKGIYELIDGERKAWELNTCVTKYQALSEPVIKNLDFFIKLRNKIEHRHIDKGEIDVLIFGECQALLFNYESLLIHMFGPKYALNEALVYSLQFSQLRTPQQQIANKSALSKDLADIATYIEKYRTSLTQQIYDSQEYSIKLIQIPKISNTDRADAAVEFVRWDQLNEDDQASYNKISVIIKDKKVKVAAANLKRLKPKKVVDNVNTIQLPFKLTMSLHTTLCKVFRIRPYNDPDDPFETNAEYCLYDETHNDYVYQPEWVTFLTNFIATTELSPEDLRAIVTSGQDLNIDDFK